MGARSRFQHALGLAAVLVVGFCLRLNMTYTHSISSPIPSAAPRPLRRSQSEVKLEAVQSMLAAEKEINADLQAQNARLTEEIQRRDNIARQDSGALHSRGTDRSPAAASNQHPVQRKLPRSDVDAEEEKPTVNCATVRCKRAFIKRMLSTLTWNARQAKVAWDGYRQYAWGYNELNPAQNSSHENTLFGSNSGATIVDSLDTLHIMGLTDELTEARKWVQTHLNFDVNNKGSVFELTIRYLGGLLSAYSLTKDAVYLSKAEDLGSRLVKAFNTPHGLPYALVNLRTGAGEKFGWVRCNCAILSEMGTLQLEFEYLSVVTGNNIYRDAANKAMNHVLSQPMDRAWGMFPNFIDYNSGHLSSSDFRLGAMGDSFYEYFFKYWRFKGGLNKWNKDRALFDEVFKNVHKHLIRKTSDGLTYIGDIEGGRFVERMDHLACFLGGTLMMASRGTKTEADAQLFESVAVGLTNTCHEAYVRAPTHLGPDIMNFNGNTLSGGSGGHSFYWLRPETVESYFYLWRHTHDEKYREWAWDAAISIEKYCRCGSGYCGLSNVYQSDPPVWHPTQESFFLAETLKYLYLTFSDDSVISLDDYVFNTEAHPLPVQKQR